VTFSLIYHLRRSHSFGGSTLIDFFPAAASIKCLRRWRSPAWLKYVGLVLTLKSHRAHHWYNKYNENRHTSRMHHHWLFIFSLFTNYRHGSPEAENV